MEKTRARPAPSLRERIAFDAPVATDDGQGGKETGWEERHTCRAHFRYLRGGETVQAARLEGRQPVVVTIRSNAAASAITPTWRMRDIADGRVFAISAPPVPSDDHLYLEITCVAGEAA